MSVGATSRAFTVLTAISATPTPHRVDVFSFNSAVGACETCRGFGRVIGVDYGLVIPNARNSRFAPAPSRPMHHTGLGGVSGRPDASTLKRRGHSRATRAWYAAHARNSKHWVVNGSPSWNGKWNQHWFGIKRFFEYLETKSYKMPHPRAACPNTEATRHVAPVAARGSRPNRCCGAWVKRLRPTWPAAGQALHSAVGVKWSREQLEALPGLSLHDLMLLPIDRMRVFFDRLDLPSQMLDDALQLLLDEIRTRLKYLCDVGLGYLSLDPPEPHAQRRRGAAHQPDHCFKAPAWSTRCSCSTSPASACTRATCTASTPRCCACATRR